MKPALISRSMSMVYPWSSNNSCQRSAMTDARQLSFLLSRDLMLLIASLTFDASVITLSPRSQTGQANRRAASPSALGQ